VKQLFADQNKRDRKKNEVLLFLMTEFRIFQGQFMHFSQPKKAPILLTSYLFEKKYYVQTLLTELSGDIFIITINRPDKSQCPE